MKQRRPLTGYANVGLMAMAAIVLGVPATLAQCPPGSVHSPAGPPGGLHGSVCVPCPAYRIANADATACVVCSNGSYPNDAQTKCIPCPAGTMGPVWPEWIQPILRRGDFCVPCPKGQVSSPGQAFCLVCRDNTVASADGSTCLQCPNGYAPNKDRTGCVKLFFSPPINSPSNQ